MMNILKKMMPFVLALFVAVGFVLGATSQGNITVQAASEEVRLDSSDVLEDLKSDPNFDVRDYPFSREGQLTVISFAEYCYSFYDEYSDNYGLYVYVYNPQALEIDIISLYNKIQMAVAYNEKGKPSDYEKFNLKFCSMSLDGDQYGKFYKFKVIDKVGSDGLTVQERVDSTERRYDVSGIELMSTGKLNAIESGVSTTFIFTGYAKGYGPDLEYPESTLKCTWEELETVTLDVHHTYWRSESSSKGEGWQNQLDSVYFQVPKRLFEEYGKLQRIKAEWYEYVTKDIVVTSNEDFYNAAIDYVGESETDGLKYGLVQDLEDVGTPTFPKQEATWAYNRPFIEYVEDYCDVLYYLFPTRDWCSIEEYDPYGDVTMTGGVYGNVLYDYMLWYSETFGSSFGEVIKDGRLSSDLFASSVDEGRTRGYTCLDIDADEDLLSWESYNDIEHGFWERVENWFTGYKPEDVGVSDLTPIQVLTAQDFKLNDTALADSLYINYNDVDDLRDVYDQAITIDGADDEEKVVVLFRFAVTDYYSSMVHIRTSGDPIVNEAYRARETVFFDFDIIQLTFNDNGVYTVIPVVASPMDFVNDITSPTFIPEEGTPLWVWIAVAIVAVVVTTIVLINFPSLAKAIWTVIKGICIGLFYVVTSPYWLIHWIIRR